jgi:hypothetical protein
MKPTIPPVPVDWWLSDQMAGEPVSPSVRQLLYELSCIGRSPDVYSLAQEVDTLESLFRLLASPEGQARANFRAVTEWIDRSGEMGEDSDHAPDELIDIYQEMGYIGAESTEEWGCTPGQLLERLLRFRRQEGLP